MVLASSLALAASATEGGVNAEDVPCTLAPRFSSEISDSGAWLANVLTNAGLVAAALAVPLFCPAPSPPGDRVTVGGRGLVEEISQTLVPSTAVPAAAAPSTCT